MTAARGHVAALVLVAGLLVLARPSVAAALNVPVPPVAAGAPAGVGSAVRAGVGTAVAGVGVSGVEVPGAGFGGLLGSGAAPLPTLTSLLGFTAVTGLAVGAAKFALDQTASVLGRTTTPQLRSTWFSATYWRMTAIATVLTLPFLFAAAVQALIRADLALLLRAAFGYLPLAMLAVGIAAPLTMLLLAVCDELSRAVSAASGQADATFLAAAGSLLASSTAQSPFLALLIGGFTVAGAVVLWIELVMREAAVYVIVLMLPLAFAALVWPARRVWATRAVEMLVALILSKFAIVAVLSLGGAAMSASLGTASIESWIAGLVLLLMAAFTPWALLRFVPLAELAAGAAGGLRHDLQRNLLESRGHVKRTAAGAHEITQSALARMRREAELAEAATSDRDGGSDGDGSAGEPDVGALDGVASTNLAEAADPDGGRPASAAATEARVGGAPATAGDRAGGAPATADEASPAADSHLASRFPGLRPDRPLVLGLGPDGINYRLRDPASTTPPESGADEPPSEDGDAGPAPADPENGRL